VDVKSVSFFVNLFVNKQRVESPISTRCLRDNLRRDSCNSEYKYV